MIWILILAYVIFLIIYILYSLAALYHLREFGFVGDACHTVIILYSAIAIAIILLSFILLFSSI
ncbi:hypothetical protein A3F08_00990 [Candidatus Berkelbacteria bacterium RIFCSPHIGHO2_12_FULL_36_9]|uniref:Uncharacterized protein n=1 Tax=Candidatus Berkelbacteria bacterium RIFCSPHIGHO2_12_FULL_36_9 TaxID=1797469 RepID=A0A1F5EJE2_9BACT|nr:MAG: hypothetical protein A3F08_00990 [Candidatus Berkelbacteria bacterium RIFCSPHIGHO2_12_FULL_36_9]